MKFLTPLKTLQLPKKKRIVVSRWTCVGEGDRVYRSKDKYFVKCVNGESQFLPEYNQTDSFTIGDKQFRVRVKEITTQREYDAYNYLRSFHYRGNGGYGRKSILVVVPTERLLPKMLGYVVICSSFMVNKPRDIVLDGPFEDGMIAWDKWDYPSRREFVNSIVRIGRVVVHPEFRGLDLGKMLIKHAFRFAKSHWQIARMKPLFVEMTADMLKYVPFAQRAGMTFVGYTEGNLRRIKRDLQYMIQKKRGKYGIRKLVIPDMQTSYAYEALEILSSNSLSLENLLRKLDLRGGALDPGIYSLVHKVIRLPKPTLMKGLTKKADIFLKRQVARSNVLHQGCVESARDFKVNMIAHSIKFQNVDLSFTTSVEDTERTCAVQEAFGIRPKQLETTVFKGLNLEIAPGEMLLVCGCSGSGKTAFLDLISQKLKPTNHPEGRIAFPPNVKIGSFETIPSDKPLIEYEGLFGGKIAEAIYVLNMAGLSEAHLYLRRFDELSEGQKYRAMMARLLNSKSNLWVADDFLSTLDPITSDIVAQNVRRFAKSVGATVVVATPHYDSLVFSLRPDRVLLKGYGWRWDLYNGTDFMKILREEAGQGNRSRRHRYPRLV